MKTQLILPLFTLGTLALAGVPAPVQLLWPQVAFVPPGTNDVRRTDIVGGGLAVAPGDNPGRPGFQPGGVGGGIVPSILTGGSPGRSSGSGSSGNGGGTGTLQSTGSALETPACTAIITAGEVPVSAFGGIVEIKVQLKPAGCRPVLGSSGSWILLAAGAQQPDLYRFSVAPNVSTGPRTGVVVLGDQKVLVQQASGSGSRFAATPGHIAISVNSEKAPTPRIVSIYSDDKSLSYTVSSTQAWLQVTPAAKAGVAGTSRFQIAVDPARLRAGRNDGYIRVTATGQPGAPLVIPVVVEVPRLR